ncbi:MAG TPA: Asp-tRNA(Asn)/Glu-tRNA(Gln) amidotransferase subunit GatA [Acidobacteriota bacterium]|jgi:aspartyl-tRNA(Asn)/glutamyl-tRNA(Gln) amidotransferase subunit A|nr:Asp-tRNA(Asn)/Glu-tRNA(Gln) amidotransferase subunit GatA [Acidobacteriota bacterium]
MTEITGLSIKQLHNGLKRKDFSVRDIAASFLARISEVDERVRAFITVEPEKVLKKADELDQRLRTRDIGMGFLTGIPLALKDNIVTEGTRTTAGSRILDNYIPPYSATVTKQLEKAGALIIGKTNCDEFAMGSSTETSAFFPTRNPWDLNRVPGGSSGGSAAAVASRQVPAALGSDTGGSIRQPAAFCGIVGLKPTYGRVSRYGLIAFASSLDQIGPMAANTTDAAMLLQAIAGHDPCDSTSASHPVDNYLVELSRDIKGLRLGVPSQWFGSGLDPVVRSFVEAAIAKLEGLGCIPVEVSLPHMEYAISTYYILAPAEASSNLARYDAVKYGYRSPNPRDLEDMYKRSRSEGFGAEVKRRIMIGTYVLSSGYYDAYYLKASKVRSLIAQDYAKAFETVDVLVGPTTTSLPFRLGEKLEDPLEMYLSDIFTVTANLAGVPAISVPCGVTDERLPVGLQIVGKHFQEALLLRVAYSLEQALDFKRPELP